MAASPRTNPRSLLTVPWVDLAGATLVAAFMSLMVLSRRGPEVNLWIFLGLGILAWLALAGAYAAATSVRPTRLLPRLWFWAVLARLAGLFANPVLEDDWHRYLWDGRVFALTGNPYAGTPADSFEDRTLPEDFHAVLDGINYPEVPTIYGPVCQLAFLLSYWVAPGQLWPLKVILMSADLVVLGLLLRLIPPRAALLYAWCPLLIQETSFNAHPDILGVCLLMTALFAWKGGSDVRAAIWSALAVGAKVLAVLLVPFLLWRARKRAWAWCAGVWGALYLPFWLQGTPADFGGLKIFLAGWEFNSTVYALLATLAAPNVAKVVCALLFAGLYAAYFFAWHSSRHQHHLPRGDWIYGVFFLLSAVVNPWYLLWLAPFVALFPTAPGLAALAVVSVSYVHGLNLDDLRLTAYQHPSWVRPFEVLVLFLAAWWHRQRRRG